MPSLDEFVATSRPRGRVSLVSRLPDEVREQLVAAFTAGLCPVREMIDWLHKDPELPEICRQVTMPMLHKWFERSGYKFGEAHGQP